MLESLWARVNGEKPPKASGSCPDSATWLRHTFATVGLEAGVDVVYVSELLGHASPAVTMAVYQHTRPERLAEANRRISQALLGT